MAAHRDLIREAYALAVALQDAGVPVKSVRVVEAGDGQETPASIATNVTIWYHGEHGYSTDGDPVSVTDEEHKVLEAFAKSATALTRSELEKAAEISNVPRVLKRLATHYAGMFEQAIRRPGGKGLGGYFARVLPISQQK